MNMSHLKHVIAALILCFTPALVADSPSVEGAREHKRDLASYQAAASTRDEDAEVIDGDAKLLPRLLRRAKGSYECIYDPRVVIPMWCSMRHSVSVTLPAGERITVASATDDDTWEVIWVKNGNEFSVRPLYPNSATSVKVLTRSGNRYMFEASCTPERKAVMSILDILPPAWMKTKLADAPSSRSSATNIGGSRQSRQVGRPPVEVDRENAALGDGDSGDEGVPLAEVQRRVVEARMAGRQEAERAAQERADELVRETVASAFKNASFDYDHKGEYPNFKIHRVWDDGNITYIYFETSTNQSPVFWAIKENGRDHEDLDAQRSVQDPNLFIVSGIFKEGVFSLEQGREIKIVNKSYSIKDRKARQKEQPAIKKVVAS